METNTLNLVADQQDMQVLLPSYEDLVDEVSNLKAELQTVKASVEYWHKNYSIYKDKYLEELSRRTNVIKNMYKVLLNMSFIERLHVAFNSRIIVKYLQEIEVYKKEICEE